MIPIYDTAPRARRPVVVLALILLNTLVFLWMLSLPPDLVLVVLGRLALVPLRYSDPSAAMSIGLAPGSIWPLITNTFLHGGWFHLIFNMWTLWIFGPAMEAHCGRLGFLVLYLAGAVVASAAHLTANWTSAEPALGASGAVAAVIAAYAVTYPRAKVILLVPVFFLPLFIPLPALFFAAFWFALQVLQGTMDLFAVPAVGGVAWWAHIGGFVFGALFARGAAALGLGRRVETRTWSGSVPQIDARR